MSDEISIVSEEKASVRHIRLKRLVNKGRSACDKNRKNEKERNPENDTNPMRCNLSYFTSKAIGRHAHLCHFGLFQKMF